MSRVARPAAVVLLVSVPIALSMSPPASADSKPPTVACTHHNDLGQCIVAVQATSGGQPTSAPAAGNRPVTCADLAGEQIACTDPTMGYWYSALGCYLRVESPQPPKSSPLWQSHTDGVIYRCTTWPPVATGVADVWFAAPPVGADPAAVAVSAERLLVLPQPSGHRSPSESQQYQGHPFTYTGLWTWTWTDPDTWQERRATATAGGVSATVAVTPTRMTFSPGDGSAAVTCAGPGRAWTSADGNGPPADGGCGYRYGQPTQTPILSAQSIDWAVTWTASDGTSGTLPDLITTRTGQLMVLQIQSVVTR